MNIPTELIEIIIDEGDYREWRVYITELNKEYAKRIRCKDMYEGQIIEYCHKWPNHKWYKFDGKTMTGICIKMNYRYLRLKDRWSENDDIVDQGRYYFDLDVFYDIRTVNNYHYGKESHQIMRLPSNY